MTRTLILLQLWVYGIAVFEVGKWYASKRILDLIRQIAGRLW